MDMLTRPDLSSDQFFEDRYASYRVLRDRFPFFDTEIDGEPCVVITRHADVDQVLRHPFVTAQPEPGKFPARVGNGPAARHYRESLPSLDHPEHTRIRRILTPAFMPKAVAKMRERIERAIERHLDRLAHESEADFIDVFAQPLAIELASLLMHMSIEQATQVLERSQELIAVLGVTSMGEGALEAADKAGSYCQAYVDDVVQALKRQSLPADDFIGVMLASEGKEGGMTRSEIVTTIIGVIIAAYHTSKAMFATTTLALLNHPDQKARLIADPGLARSCWEEGLRYDGPVHFMHRYASQPITVGDRVLEPGRRLVVGLQAGNRDERRFPEPDRFIIDRTDNRHLAFAGGPHFCIGAQLVRLEGELLFQRLFQRFPKMALQGLQYAPIRDISFPMLLKLTVSLR